MKRSQEHIPVPSIVGTPLTPLGYCGGPFESSRLKAANPVERRSLKLGKPRGPARRSCDFCFTRKKKCDGDGFNHCSYCLSKGQVTCTYSDSRKFDKRLGHNKHLVTKGTAGRGELKQAGSSLRRIQSYVCGNLRWKLRQARSYPVEHCPVSQSLLEVQRAPEAELYGASIPTTPKELILPEWVTDFGRIDTCVGRWTKCRMAASLATGLIGSEENNLLRDFFDCMSYMPLTSPSEIRGAIMNIMSFGSENQDFCHHEVEDDGMITFASSGADDDDDHTRLATTSSRVSSNAMICIFWCAVTMGGLIQGRPESSVASYIRRAEDALSLCQGVAVAETVRALGLMAVLYGFMERDQDDLETCLEHRLKMIGELDPAESKKFLGEGFELYVKQPPSPEETVSHVESMAAYLAPSKKSPRVPLLKMSDLSEENVYFHVADLASGLLRDMVRAIMAANATRPAAGTKHDTGTRRPDSLSSRDGVDPIRLSNSRGQSSGPACYAPLLDFIRCNMGAIQRLRQASRSLRSHSGVPRSSSPSRGFGVAIPLQIILSLTSVAIGDREAVMEEIYFAADGLIRHPGLGRFIAYHILYTIITLVCASLGDHATYYKITDGFHALGLTGMARFPSLEKRRVEMIPCGHMFCRIAEQFLREHGWGAVLRSDSPAYHGECGSGNESMAMVMPNDSETPRDSSVTACHSPHSPTSHEEATLLCSIGGDSSAPMVDKTHHRQQLPGDVIDEADWSYIATTLSACVREPPRLSCVQSPYSDAKSSCQEPVGYW